MRWCWLLVAAGCAKGGSAGERDAPADDCNMTWYADMDGDGHGDPAAGVDACSQPAKTTATADDCDDTERFRHPDAPEVCDGFDNDCNPSTTETCPANCQAVKRPAPDTGATYLFCNVGAGWTSARATCASVQNFHLIQIDDAAENAWLRSAATMYFGTTDSIHIGGNDGATEGMWRWDGGNDPFWQGGSGGTAIGGRFSAWGGGEPNDNGTEDCAEMRGDALWNDGDCPDGQRFVCER